MSKYLLKNGIVVDGTGKNSYIGNVFIRDDRIEVVSQKDIICDCDVIDCTGLVISPGFIDAHSHHDWHMGRSNELECTEPFLRQGVTTHIAGNCGAGVAGFQKNSPYKKEIKNGLFKLAIDEEGLPWDTYPEFFDSLNKKGFRQNLAVFAGHGYSLLSVVGAVPKKRYSDPCDLDKVKRLLEDAMDAGCKGISFGLGYCPASQISDDEIYDIAKLAMKRNKVFTIHGRTMRAYSPELYGEDMSMPHNVRWLTDFAGRFRDSGAKFHYSHLVFMGRKAWETYDQMLELVQDLIDNTGIDFWFDMYSYWQGIADLGINMPFQFFERLKQDKNVFFDKEFAKELDKIIDERNKMLGFYASDLQVGDPVAPELAQYSGMFLDEICKARGVSHAQNLMDFYRLSNAGASLYTHVVQPPERIPELMTHERVLYMADAPHEKGPVKHPCAYGSFVRFLRIARETGNLPLEQVITRMTGRTATRFDLDKRGVLKEGNFADVVVFDPEIVADTNTSREPDRFAVGIVQLFINGQHVLRDGKLDPNVKAGRIV